MKTCLLIFLCLFASFSLSAGSQFLPCEKTYVASDRIHFCQNQIFAQIESLLICTSAIYSDGAGLFFMDYRASDCADNEWECQHCLTCNPFWYTLCRKCHRIR